MTSGTRPTAVGMLCVAVLTAGATGVAVGTDEANEPPLADAGLDRDVTVNATVYLDATGSRDPDGSITAYEWSVERPDGTTMSPDCRDCAETEFAVGEPGQYNATVTVTDDDGVERSDTLYVTVSEAEGPDVSLSGPSSLLPDESGGFDATIDAGDADLARVDWETDGDRVARENVDGRSLTHEESLSFEAGTHEVSVTVYDELGRSDTATTTVEVEPAEPENPDNRSDTVPDPPDSDSDDPCRYGSGQPTHDTCDADSVISAADGEVVIVDADMDGQVTLNGETYENVTESDTISLDLDEWEEHRTRNQLGEKGLGEIYKYSGEESSGGSIVGSSAPPEPNETDDDEREDLIEASVTETPETTSGTDNDPFSSVGSTANDSDDGDGSAPQNNPNVPDRYQW